MNTNMSLPSLPVLYDYQGNRTTDLSPSPSCQTLCHTFPFIISKFIIQYAFCNANSIPKNYYIMSAMLHKQNCQDVQDRCASKKQQWSRYFYVKKSLSNGYMYNIIKEKKPASCHCWKTTVKVLKKNIINLLPKVS